MSGFFTHTLCFSIKWDRDTKSHIANCIFIYICSCVYTVESSFIKKACCYVEKIERIVQQSSRDCKVKMKVLCTFLSSIYTHMFCLAECQTASWGSAAHSRYHGLPFPSLFLWVTFSLLAETSPHAQLWDHGEISLSCLFVLLHCVKGWCFLPQSL